MEEVKTILISKYNAMEKALKKANKRIELLERKIMLVEKSLRGRV